MSLKRKSFDALRERLQREAYGVNFTLHDHADPCGHCVQWVAPLDTRTLAVLLYRWDGREWAPRYGHDHYQEALRVAVTLCDANGALYGANPVTEGDRDIERRLA